MSLKGYYKPISVYRFSEGDFGSPSGYAFSHMVKGIIQAPSNSNTFLNGKDTSNIAGVLFADVGVDIREKDKVSDGSKSYLVSGAGSQSNGVTGIKAHHVEYSLVFDNDG